jgi:biopolymer transport protein ExbD
MRSQKRKKRIDLKESEMPMSSMIDVVFLLLIYFIVVQKPIIDLTLLQTDLPSPDPPDTTIQHKILLRIDVVRQLKNDGHHYYRMNGRWWKDELLFSQLEKISQTNSDTTVMINCGPNARHEMLVTLLDACAKVELTNLNIVNDASIEFQGNQ